MKKQLFLAIALFLAAHQALAQIGPDAPGRGARTAAQQDFIETYGDEWTVRQHERTGVPISIFVSVSANHLGGNISYVRLSGSHPEAQALRFFLTHKEMFGFRPDVDELRKASVRQDRELTYVRLKQYYKDVPVYTGNYTVTIGGEGFLHMVSGRFFPEISLEKTPNIGPAQAIAAAISTTGTLNTRRDPDAELVIYPGESEYALAYKVMVPADDPPRNWLVFVDAVSAEIIEVQDVTPYIAEGIFEVNPEQAEPSAAGASPLLSTTGTGDIYPDNPGNSSLTTVNLYRLDGSGYNLYGTYVDVHNDDVPDADTSTSTFQYDPSHTHFDEVNVYHHIDTYAAYLPNISFPGLGRTIEATVHDGTNQNNAFYDITVQMTSSSATVTGSSSMTSPKRMT